MKNTIGVKNHLYPMPVTIVGTNVAGNPNYVTIAHVGILDFSAVSISLSKTHYTNLGIEVNSNTPLFLSRKGNQKSITRQQVSQIIRGICKQHEIEGKVNIHSFRKCFVTKIYELTGYNIAETKKYSRHKNLANLDYYIATTEDTNLVNQLNWE